jgi:uncharacterized protein YkwD
MKKNISILLLIFISNICIANGKKINICNADTSVIHNMIFDEINKKRLSDNKKKLKLGYKFYNLALIHTKYISSVKYVTHYSADSISPFDRYNDVKFRYEIVSKTQIDINRDIQDICKKIITQYYNSKYHRPAILGESKYVTISYYIQKTKNDNIINIYTTIVFYN